MGTRMVGRKGVAWKKRDSVPGKIAEARLGGMDDSAKDVQPCPRPLVRRRRRRSMGPEGGEITEEVCTDHGICVHHIVCTLH